MFELTKPVNVSEGGLLIPIVKTLKEHIKVFRQALITDGAYDNESNLKFIVQELKAKPVVARNLCWEKHKEHKLSRKGTPICIARSEMIYWGRFCDRGRVRLKYVCPIIHSKSYKEKYYFCPWNHPKFTERKGYYVYIRGDDTVRRSIDYGSAEFKRLYSFRTASRGYHLEISQLGYVISIC